MNDRTEEKLEELLRAAKQAPELKDDDAFTGPPPGLVTKVVAQWSSVGDTKATTFLQLSWIERASAVVLGLASLWLVVVIPEGELSSHAQVSNDAAFDQLVFGDPGDDDIVGFF